MDANPSAGYSRNNGRGATSTVTAFLWYAEHCFVVTFSDSQASAMKLSNQSAVPVYTISGSSTARPLPEWLARKRKRSLKNDPEYASRIELLQDFEFEEASQCVRVSDDGQWVMSTGVPCMQHCVLQCPAQALQDQAIVLILY